MFLKALRKLDVIKVVEAVYRIAKRIVVLFLNQEVVVSLVHCFDIKLRGNINIHT